MQPCPFCGGEGSLQTNRLLQFWEVRIHCSSCGADGPPFRYRHQNDKRHTGWMAEAAWDCRMPDPQ